MFENIIVVPRTFTLYLHIKFSLKGYMKKVFFKLKSAQNNPLKLYLK